MPVEQRREFDLDRWWALRDLRLGLRWLRRQLIRVRQRPRLLRRPRPFGFRTDDPSHT